MSTAVPAPDSSRTAPGQATVGVDVGGTFTDVVVTDPAGAIHVTKVLTTPRDPLLGVRRGVRLGLERAGVEPADVGRLVHGTTLATNVILQRTGVDVAFVTTAGFGDLFRLGREARVEEDRYDLGFTPPRPPLDPRLTFEAQERMTAEGERLVPLAAAHAARLAADIAARHPAAVAICFLHSWANPEHEQVMAEAVARALPEAYITVSSDVWPEMREFERGMTTLLSAYVGPVMSRYLTRLEQLLAEDGLTSPVYVMDSAGGVMMSPAAARRPILTVESGGAAGVVAAGQIGARVGYPHVLSFDMGGTTAKVGLVHDGRPGITHSFEVSGKGSFGVSRSGSGLPVKTPVADLAEVGAGGGSVAWLDPAGTLRVGPRSAGADPGPVCYGRGGTEPTVTDANLLLGYLAPAGLADDVAVSADAAADALARQVADPLGVSVTDAARAVYDIAVASMAAAIRVVTVQRGVDPRDFAVVAFGGAGPTFAARLAETFGITSVVVPAAAGVASAVGLLHADLSMERLRTAICDTDDTAVSEVENLVGALEKQVVDEPGVDPERVVVHHSVDIRYQGQAHQLTVPAEAADYAEPGFATLVARFRDRYRRTYGLTLTTPTQLVTFRARATSPAGEPGREVVAPGAVARGGDGQGGDGRGGPPERTPTPGTRRQAYFAAAGAAGGAGEFVDTPVFRQERLDPAVVLAGPALVDSAESTTVVPPGFSARADAGGNLHLTVDSDDPTR